MKRLAMISLALMVLFVSFGCIFEPPADVLGLKKWQEEEIYANLPRSARVRFGEWKVKVISQGRPNIFYSSTSSSLDNPGITQCYIGWIPIHAEYRERDFRLRKSVNLFFVAEFYFKHGSQETEEGENVKINLIVLDAFPEDYFTLNRYKNFYTREFQGKWEKDFGKNYKKLQS